MPGDKNGVVTAIKEITKDDEIVCLVNTEKMYDFWHCLVRSGETFKINNPAEFGVVDEIFPTEDGAWKFRLKYPYNERRNPNTHILDVNGAIFNYLVVHVKNESKESKEDKAKKDDKAKKCK